MTDEPRGWPYEPVDRGPGAAAVAVAEPVVQSVRDDGPEDRELAVPTVRSGWFVALVIALGLSAALSSFSVADWWSRNRELDVLLHRIAQAELAQRPLQVALRQVQQLCAFTAPRCELAPLRAAAASALPQLQSTGATVAGTSIVRYHGPMRDLRDRYVDHNTAWQAWASDLLDGTDEIDQPGAISSTWYVVSDVARDALPPFALHDARDRVDRIFHT